MRADMHVHTYYSDGTQSPAEAVEGALSAGLGLVVLTDHDGTAGTAEFASLCAEAGLLTVPGAEISAYEGDVKVHTLAYGMDVGCPSFARFMERLRAGAEERARDTLKKLGAVGVRVSMEAVEAERREKSSPLHAMHIAEAGAKAGYAADRFEFYDRYLSSGGPGFSTACRPDPYETADEIHAAGGIVSLAHPGRITMTEEDKALLVGRMVDRGLDALEAVYSEHDEAATERYLALAERYSLMVTGGSDTHSREGRRRIGTPEFRPGDRLLSALGLS